MLVAVLQDGQHVNANVKPLNVFKMEWINIHFRMKNSLIYGKRGDDTKNDLIITKIFIITRRVLSDLHCEIQV